MALLTYREYLKLRKGDDKNFHLNFGGQMRAFSCTSDIVIMVGNRGSSKTTAILTKTLSNVFTKNYYSVYLRKEVKDSTGTGGIVDASKKIFSQFGTLRESLQFLDWSFTSGAKSSFINYSAPIEEFKTKIQGKEISHMFVDEITQMALTHAGIIMANLRNTINVKPQLYGTCNPDANSWVKDLISPYIDFTSKYHTHKPEMNGREIYFFQTGSTIKDCVYGATKEEVYENAKENIDELIKNSGIENADYRDAILSLTVFYIPKSENKHLINSKGGGLSYDARMGMMSLQERIYAIYGGWKKVDDNELSIVKQQHLDNWFSNSMMRTGVRYASMDLSGKGNDLTFLIIWDGYHIENIHSTKGKNAKELYEWTLRTLSNERISLTRRTFVYDAGGLGYAFSGFFSDDEAFQFQSSASASESSKVKSYDNKSARTYGNLRSEVCGKFLKILTDNNEHGECGISINEDILDKEFFGKTVRQRIEFESKGLRWKSTTIDGVLKLISKDEMDHVIGYHSDMIMAILYRFALDITEKNVSIEATSDQVDYIASYF